MRCVPRQSLGTSKNLRLASPHSLPASRGTIHGSKQGRRAGKTFISTALEGHRTNLVSTGRSYDQGPAAAAVHKQSSPCCQNGGRRRFRTSAIYVPCASTLWTSVCHDVLHHDNVAGVAKRARAARRALADSSRMTFPPRRIGH